MSPIPFFDSPIIWIDVFLTKKRPFYVYFTYKTKGTGSSGAPFFFFLFLYKTSSLAFTNSWCFAKSYSLNGISPIDSKSFLKKFLLCKLFLDNPKNYIFFSYSTKLHITSPTSLVKLFPEISRLFKHIYGMLFILLINSLNISSPRLFSLRTRCCIVGLTVVKNKSFLIYTFYNGFH